ncbi:hypothetical protein [Methanofollis ethanolicus]|uniref:hypothetical protein n=1 Tax=Methanofollis ethanolicus TaxID=488124 RepID=UPI0013656AAE|nr:hypothetical protein [Methanofollis ethanolicus]
MEEERDVSYIDVLLPDTRGHTPTDPPDDDGGSASPSTDHAPEMCKNGTGRPLPCM